MGFEPWFYCSSYEVVHRWFDGQSLVWSIGSICDWAHASWCSWFRPRIHCKVSRSSESLTSIFDSPRFSYFSDFCFFNCGTKCTSYIRLGLLFHDKGSSRSDGWAGLSSCLPLGFKPSRTIRHLIKWAKHLCFNHGVHSLFIWSTR